MTAILFAFGSMACAAANDVIFKLYARKSSPVGLYILVIGVIWAAVFGTLMIARENGLGTPAVFWGMISGLFSVAANLLLVEAMKRMEMGVCATVYRMNLIPAAIMAAFLFDEHFSIWKTAGLAAAAIAVILFAPRANASGAGTAAGRQGWMLILAACLCRAGLGIGYKWGLSEGAPLYGILFANGATWVVGGMLYWLILETRLPAHGHVIARHGIPSGLFVSGIVLFLGLALRCGEASTVLPVAQLSFIPTCAAGVILLREAVSARKIAGIAMAVCCIIFMTLGTGDHA